MDCAVLLHCKSTFLSQLFLSAMKCNNDPVLLKMLTGLGIGFDCASKVKGSFWFNELDIRFSELLMCKI